MFKSLLKLLKKKRINISIKYFISIIFLLLSLITFIDLFETPFEIKFPFEAGGIFYSSLEIYLLKGIVITIINSLPVFFMIFKKFQMKFTNVSLFVLFFDLLYFLFLIYYYQ